MPFGSPDAPSTGIQVAGPSVERADEVLTPDALALVAALHRALDGGTGDLDAGRRRIGGSKGHGSTPPERREHRPSLPDRKRRTAFGYLAEVRTMRL